MDELDKGFADLMAAAQNPRREGLLPARFFVEPMKDEAKSAAEGRNVCVDVEMIEIRIDRDIVRRRVTEEDKIAYAAQYLAFKRGVDQSTVEGSPLRDWPILTRSQVEEFQFSGIRTVEQLAAAADTVIQRIGPYMHLRQKARDWLAAAKDNAALGKLRDENEALRQRLAALERMVETQAKDIDKARSAGPSETDRFAALEAQIAALAAAQTNGKRKGKE